MKNITKLRSLQECCCCHLEGFFVYTPDGGDYVTCPACGYGDFGNLDETHYKIDETVEDNRNTYNYCERCQIIYDIGCVHSYMGCTSDVYNCHFISRWKDQRTGIEYEGMPQFVDKDDWYMNVNNVEIIEMCCPHKNNICLKTYHKVEPGCKLVK